MEKAVGVSTQLWIEEETITQVRNGVQHCRRHVSTCARREVLRKLGVLNTQGCLFQRRDVWTVFCPEEETK